jgi:hypothetical protein
MVEADGLLFVPSRVMGLADVTEFRVYPDRLDVISPVERWSIPFADIASWPRPAFLHRCLASLGWNPRWLPVGERAWSQQPSSRFFRFYTWPPIMVFLPDEPADTPFENTLFHRIENAIQRGGFSLWNVDDTARRAR